MAISIPMNLSDANERGNYEEIEPGIYAGKTKSIEPHSGGKSMTFTVELDNGQVVDIALGIDLTKKGNRNSWYGMLASHGKNMEKIKQAGDKFTFSDAMVLAEGKNSCFVLVTKVDGMDDQGRPKLNDKTFVSKERAEALKAAGGKARAAAPANGAAGVQAPAGGAPAPAGTPAANLFD